MVLLKVLKLSLARLVVGLCFPDFFVFRADFVQDFLVGLLCSFEIFFLSLPLFVVADKGLVVFLNLGYHFALLLQEFVLLLVEFPCFLNDVVFLLGETVVDLPLLPLLLEKPDSLEWTLALDDESAHFVEVFVG